MCEKGWLAERRALSQMTSLPIPFRETRRWRFERGGLRHETGGFFSVVGLRNHLPKGGTEDQPIILQPEIGILGLLVRRGKEGMEALVQAKAEPGNVKRVQLSPTVQATVSNYTRLHGGAPTPHLDIFLHPAPGTVKADSLQSEQGTRFLGKYNRNLTVLAEGEGQEPSGPNWRWVPLAGLLGALPCDFEVNTDLRSVIACSDWDLLGGSPAFSRWKGTDTWEEELHRSFMAENDGAELPLRSLVGRLEEARVSDRSRAEVVPLEGLKGWRLEEDRLVDEEETRFSVVARRVHAPCREVSDWDQPLIEDAGEGLVVLACALRRGVLHFLFRPRLEPGFREKVQFGPSLQRGPGSGKEGASDPLDALVLSPEAEERISCLLSEEGGRFNHCSCRYRVVRLPEGLADPPIRRGAIWATLGQVRALLRSPGSFTNEARSALALLLSRL